MASFSIIDLDPARLDLASVDEDESDAVAICVLESIFAETNAQYHQHAQSKRAMAALATLLADNIFDTIFSSQLAPDHEVDEATLFLADRRPAPDVSDRHVVRSVVIKSPLQREPLSDKSIVSLASRAESTMSRVGAYGNYHHHRHSFISKARSRPRANSNSSLQSLLTPSASAPAVGHGHGYHRPVTFAIADTAAADENDEEDLEIKQWRLRCLKELEATGKKKPLVKWAAVARAFASVDEPHKSSIEIELTDNMTPLLKQETMVPPSSIKTKLNIDSFASIADCTLDSAGPSSRRPSLLSSSESAPTLSDSKMRKTNAIQLNDQLSRKRQSPSSASHHASHHAWKFETPTKTALFRPEALDFRPSTIPNTIALEPGVALMQGEVRYEGPERVETGQSMSRKRFDLHQRLTTDFILHSAVERDVLSVCGTPPTSNSPKFYDEVPAEPVQVPHLSPLSAASLAIPRTHLAQSLSVPSLRVRACKSSRTSRLGKLETEDNAPSPTNASARPSTAIATSATNGLLGPVATKKPTEKTNTDTTATATKKYLREFPKPQAGVIKLSTKAAAAIADERHRMAWIT